jgi:hypothetical protein
VRFRRRGNCSRSYDCSVSICMNKDQSCGDVEGSLQ